MRGKGPPVADVWKRSGITPAYAGKRHLLNHSQADNQDHPRLCGEKPTSIFFVKMNSGSPPPMRGKVMHRKFQLLADGITPAYAGKSY